MVNFNLWLINSVLWLTFLLYHSTKHTPGKIFKTSMAHATHKVGCMFIAQVRCRTRFHILWRGKKGKRGRVAPHQRAAKTAVPVGLGGATSLLLLSGSVLHQAFPVINLSAKPVCPLS